MTAVTELAAWKALAEDHKALDTTRTRDLFAAEPDRFARYSLTAADLLFDYSKNRFNQTVLDHLLELARDSALEARRDAMFNGEAINTTEHRSVLHVALRNRSDRPLLVDGRNVMDDVNAVLRRMKDITQAVHGGTWVGYSGKTINDVVNIGIGGSDLGPATVVEALKPFQVAGMTVRFVSNVDATQLVEATRDLDPERTLFLVASKTFTTLETLTNARSARDWVLAAHDGDAAATARHFVALSTNAEEVAAFGIDTNNMFAFWDWVGGRYSLWSAIGLSIAMAVGWDNFEALLAGAHAMDEHFRTAPLAENMPVLMGLMSVWNVNFEGALSHAVLPYDQYLEKLPAHLQQLAMESNGKSVTLDGADCTWNTEPVIFGQPGTNGQHAFYQLIHQGRTLVSNDFILVAHSHNPLGDHQVKLLANGLAQTEALMRGKTLEEATEELTAAGMDEAEVARLAAHKVMPGSRPVNTLLLDRVTPATVGALIALYEHRMFVEGCVWRINTFDQWGVELGKVMAKVLIPEISGDSPVGDHDASTVGLLERLRTLRNAG